MTEINKSTKLPLRDCSRKPQHPCKKQGNVCDAFIKLIAAVKSAAPALPSALNHTVPLTLLPTIEIGISVIAHVSLPICSEQQCTPSGSIAVASLILFP